MCVCVCRERKHILVSIVCCIYLFFSLRNYMPIQILVSRIETNGDKMENEEMCCNHIIIIIILVIKEGRFFFISSQ